MNVVQKTKERAQLMLQAVERAEKLGQEDFKGILESLTYGGWAEKIIPKWYPHQYRLKPQKRNMTLEEFQNEFPKAHYFWCLYDREPIDNKRVAYVTDGKIVVCLSTGIKCFTVSSFCKTHTRPDGTKFEVEEE